MEIEIGEWSESGGVSENIWEEGTVAFGRILSDI